MGDDNMEITPNSNEEPDIVAKFFTGKELKIEDFSNLIYDKIGTRTKDAFVKSMTEHVGTTKKAKKTWINFGSLSAV